MGRHTWFYKSIHIKKKMDDLDDDLDDGELEDEFDKLFEENRTPYHDIFRTHHVTIDPNEDQYYIYSLSDAIRYYDENIGKNIKTAKGFTPLTREEVIERLTKFWEEYPEGYIGIDTVYDGNKGEDANFNGKTKKPNN